MNEKIKAYPQTEKFKVIDTIGVPHPYCITHQHVSWAADHFGGMLGKEAIEDAEKRGKARCDICKGKLTFSQHETALLVEVDDSRPLAQVDGLKEYLLSIKDQAEKDHFAGFAFKQKTHATTQKQNRAEGRI